MAVDEKKLSKGRRSKLGRRTPTSDPNLNSSLFGPSKIEYPPGFTVDDLWLFRRKKPAGDLVEDNLKLPHGSFKLIKSEYTTKYRDYYSTSDLSKEELTRSLKPESALKLEGLQEFHSEYNDSYTPYPYEKNPRIAKPSRRTLELITADEMENNVNVESPEKIIDSRKPKTSLQLEGDLEFLTEHAEKFIEYLLSDRRHLLKKPTSLHLLGEMEKKTETAEQFKPYDLERRPPLCKKFTNLHLEGDMNIVTEKQESFKTYQMSDRPVIRKKPTNLHLEGALTLAPEYRSEYVDHKIVERTKLVLPTNNLKADGSYENIPENKSPFINTIHPVIPHLRESVNSPCPSRPPSGMMGERRGTLRSQLSRSHQNLLFDLNKNVYVEGMERCRTPVKGRRAVQPEERVKTPTKASYYRDYVSPERVKQVRRPHEMFSSDGELDYYVTKNEASSRSPSPKHKSELCISEPKYNSDGRFICQPEYRRAYVDYLIRERIDRKPRTIDFLNQHKPRVFDGNGTTDDSMDRQITTTSSSDIVPTTNKNNKPSSASSNSIEVVKNENKKMKIRSYSQIEEEAFGPRLPIPPRRRTSSSSRSSSPRPPSTRRRTTSQNNNSQCYASQSSIDSDVPQNKYKFATPVRVENIACKQGVAPLRSAAAPIRSKWMREDSTQSEPAAAFYILDDSRTGNSAKHRSFTDGNLNRVEKCVTPSWYKH